MHLLSRLYSFVFYVIPLVVMLLGIGTLSCAGPLESAGYRSAQQSLAMEGDESPAEVPLPPGARMLQDIGYGPDARQRMDVYLPPHPDGAPVIFMVHGGAWRLGDKRAASVVENKVARWVTKGFIFISTNYRMLPDIQPLEQKGDIARALATAQEKANSWGGDPDKFIVMGHSAGAHLAALLAASPVNAYKSDVKPWLGTILLDSAALDVVKIMESRHFRFYDRAFGSDHDYWNNVSPVQILSESAKPILAVCSTRRSDSCDQAHQFANKAHALKVRIQVLEEDLSHREINQKLGEAGHYTDEVESFLASLDIAVGKILASTPGTAR